MGSIVTAKPMDSEFRPETRMRRYPTTCPGTRLNLVAGDDTDFRFTRSLAGGYLRVIQGSISGNTDHDRRETPMNGVGRPEFFIKFRVD